jgi:hypothetical protein
VERFPPAPELPFDEAVARLLRAMDPAIGTDRVRAVVDGRREEDVRRALARTRQVRPADTLGYFTAALGRRVEPELATRRSTVTPLRGTPDPYSQ